VIKKVDHIAIAVNNLNEVVELYGKIFGLKPEHIKDVPDQGVKAALIPVGNGTEIEFLEPINPQGGVAKFLEKKGEGIHHIALEVDDVEQEIKSLVAKGVEMIDKQPRMGLAGKIAFIHPKSTRGILIELCQKV
jgi:methylmalonyl-CoA/ethylmalonyl-CoA epimerase